MAVVVIVVFAVVVIAGAAIVLNQVSTWFYSAYSACARWLVRRRS